MIFFYIYLISFLFFFFFFNDPAPPEIYTLPLHDALPISVDDVGVPDCPAEVGGGPVDFARLDAVDVRHCPLERDGVTAVDRKSTRLNSSHSQISYAVFCLKKKKKTIVTTQHDNYTAIIDI